MSATPPWGTPILTGALLAIIDDAGLAVATLTENLTRQELLGSRLTRAEVQRQLRLLAGSAARMPPDVWEVMPEIDWEGWTGIERLLGQGGVDLDEALWFAVESMVPATLLWLRLYRRSQPALFRIAP